MEEKQIASDWRISDLWNELVVQEQKVTPRNYIRASEIGKSYYERFLAMKGTPITNPYPPRVRRIFDTGLVFEIDVVERIFKLLGLVQESQKEVTLELPGLLPVVGHFDYKVGGKINVEQAKKEIDDPHTSKWMKERAIALLNVLQEKYPHGFKTLITEIKSINSRSFWYSENQDSQTGFFKGYPHHKLQLFTYLMSEDEPEGRLFYVSKDDMTLMETPVSINDINLKMLWLEDVKKMTEYFKNDEEPPRPEDIIFNERKQMWELNWQVMRSPYFTLMTGKQTVDEWQNALRDELKKKNTAKCSICQKEFSLLTLNKNNGQCARCAKKGGE